MLLLAAAALLAEMAAVYFALTTHQLGTAIALHALILTGIGLWVLQARNRRWAAVLLLATSVTGPFGAAICLLSTIAYGWSNLKAVSPAEWIEEFLAQQISTASERAHERLHFGLDAGATGAVLPFQDILKSGTVLQKQLTIAKITRYFRPQFAAMLREATHDASPAVRVQAATALAKIERDFMTRYLAAKKILSQSPENL
jgi:hypothetical protein